MQCTNHLTPSYYHSRDLNVGAVDVAWHLSNTNVEEKGHNVLTSPSHVDQHLVCNKEVQELHRLYRRQNAMMNGIRMTEVIRANLQSDYHLSGLRCEISQIKLDTTSWMRGNCSDSKLFGLPLERTQQPSVLVARNFQKPASLWRKHINHEIHDLPNKKGVHDMRILNLEHPVNVSEAIEAPNASNSGHVLATSGDLLSFNSSSRKRNFLIDLNEPIQLDEKSEVANSDKCSFAIDLNSVPDMFLPEEKEIDSKFLKSDSTFIDLNTDMHVDEPSLPLSNTNIETKEQELQVPVSPENKETFPPRRKSVEIQEPCVLDETVAESLIMFSSLGVNNNVKSAFSEVAGNFFNPLCWFAEVASSFGDDLVNKQIDTRYAADNDKDENCETLCGIVVKEKERLGCSVQCKLQKKSLASLVCFPKLVDTSELSKSGSLMINTRGKRKKLSVKQRKYLMLSSSNSVKKYMNKKDVLPSWGIMKQRTARKYLL